MFDERLMEASATGVGQAGGGVGLAQEPAGGGAPASGRPAARPDERLAAARRALALAEERAGLRTQGAREVQRAMGAAVAAPLDAGLPDATTTRTAACDPWQSLGAQEAGVVTISGSTALLLAAAARHQGPHGWCAVLGGQDLGWCAAAELGLDLSRVLVVPAAGLDPAALLSAASALLDGVGVLLIGYGAARALRPRSRRLLAVRARERRALILTGAAWEGARTLQAEQVSPDDGHPAGPWGQDSQKQESRGRGSRVEEPGEEAAPEGAGVVVALRPPGPAPAPARGPAGHRPPADGGPPATGEAGEMETGYLRRLAWSLTEPHRGHGPSLLVLGEQGLSQCPSTAAPTGLRALEGAG